MFSGGGKGPPSPSRGRGFKGEGSSSSKKARTEEWRGKGKGGRTAAEYSTDEEDETFVEKEVPDDDYRFPSNPYPEYCAPEGCLLVRDPNNHREARFRMAELPWENSEDEAEAAQNAWEDIVAETDARAKKIYRKR